MEQSDLSFETFDPTPYQSVPHLTAEGTLALAQALVLSIPEPAPAPLDRLAARLRDAVHEAEAALTTRRRESAPTDYAAEVALDGLTDALWATLRDKLQTWSAFEHDALISVLEGMPEPDADVLWAARDEAERARVLRGRLFGTEGLMFTQRPYPEQAQRMASMLRLVDEDGLADAIEQLAGPEILVALRGCQARYQQMVDDRMVRSMAPSVDLGQLRRSLQRVIVRYASAALTLLDEDDPASLAMVIDALRPIEVARARLARGRTRASTDDDSSSAEPSEALAPAGPAPTAAV